MNFKKERRWVVIVEDSVVGVDAYNEIDAKQKAIEKWKEIRKENFFSGDKVRDKSNPKYTGVIEYTWFENEIDTHDANYETGPIPNMAEIVWDISGCASDMLIKDLEKINEN